DLIYNKDKSWTFNSRFETAKSNLDYKLAFEIACEKHGFLLRNLIQFLRMKVGVSIPIRDLQNQKSNVMASFLSQKTTKSLEKKVRTDASDYFSDADGLLYQTLNEDLNLKLAWQMIEIINDDSIYNSMFERVVQGKKVKYKTPIPPVDEEFAIFVKDILLKLLKDKLSNRFNGKIYIEDDVPVSYSGHKETSISYSGEFLTTGTKLKISELSKQGRADFLRMGVLWRHTNEKEVSVDLDLSSVFIENNNGLFREHVIFYGDPEFEINRNLIAVSSGDVTSCGGQDSLFSSEFIDVDIELAKKNNILDFFNNVIVYDNKLCLGELETYFFFSFIDKEDRVMNGNEVTLDLNNADYAIRVDPDNVEKSKSQIGFYVDLNDDTIEIVNLSCKKGTFGDNSINMLYEFNELLRNRRKPLMIKSMLSSVYDVTNNPFDADLIISRKDNVNSNLKTLCYHPSRDFEKINQLLF
ncbi:hypothetical protein KY334_07780, partial [Candidatus Woesearchaeota archaeon]|nr:hypothetical protein [Candidatus Woesearchaeota archaeon]